MKTMRKNSLYSIKKSLKILNKLTDGSKSIEKKVNFATVLPKEGHYLNKPPFPQLT